MKTKSQPNQGRRRGAARMLTLALAGAAMLALPAHAAQLYRFTNSQGGLELSYSIPNDRVPYGYEVIDSQSGRLLRTVAPQLTPAEAAAKAEHERRMGVCKIAQRRVQTMYESDADIDDAETKAMQSLETRIVNAQANLTHLINQRSRLEDQAAQLERSGRGVTRRLIANLERANNQIKTLEREISQRHAERKETRDGYELDRSIFALGDCEVASASPLFDEQTAADSDSDEQLADNG